MLKLLTKGKIVAHGRGVRIHFVLVSENWNLKALDRPPRQLLVQVSEVGEGDCAGHSVRRRVWLE